MVHLLKDYYNFVETIEKFAKKYVELLKVDFFKNIDCLNWTENIKKKITQS